MIIKSSQFISSNVDFTKCPKLTQPEYAFIGRSNVGKSSFINALTERKQLARISKKPGKTQCINHFLINNEWYLVDLPGYGYAKTGKKKQQEFKKILTNYLLHRRNLLYTFLLIDIRHEAQENDLNFIRWMGKNQLPFVIVFTKADKVKKTHIDTLLTNYKNILLKEWEEIPSYFIVSSLKKEGIEDIKKFIQKANKKFIDYIRSPV